MDLKYIKNNRIVVHWLSFQKQGEKITYEIAINRAKNIQPSVRKFNNKQFGGGIAFYDFKKFELESQICNYIQNLKILENGAK